ncbi:MAG: ferritin-like domain-containing protein [Planctomycetes bacterium]|nr:ferritin-like domain-containing protein [Planctomycetota bacterium]
MAESSATFHEPLERLSEATLDQHRGLASLMEELEAIDWYQQRIDATSDESLKSILAHNRDEEKEHAAMALEWLRRRDSALDAKLRIYLFQDRPILKLEEEAEEGAASGDDGDGALGIGSLR